MTSAGGRSRWPTRTPPPTPGSSTRSAGDEGRTDADPDAGRQEIHEALEGATAVPLEVAELAADVAGLANRLVSGGNPNLEGDAAAAVHLARAAARAAARLVELNVAQGKLDGDWCDQAAAHVTRAEAG